VGDEHPGAVPGLDGRSVHTEASGDLVEGEQAPRSQSFGVGGELMGAT